MGNSHVTHRRLVRHTDGCKSKISRRVGIDGAPAAGLSMHTKAQHASHPLAGQVFACSGRTVDGRSARAADSMMPGTRRSARREPLRAIPCLLGLPPAVSAVRSRLWKSHVHMKPRAFGYAPLSIFLIIIGTGRVGSRAASTVRERALHILRKTRADLLVSVRWRHRVPCVPWPCSSEHVAAVAWRGWNCRSRRLPIP